MPDGQFHLVLCRNLAFTYFEETLQRKVLAGIVQRLLPGGAIAIASHESLSPAIAQIQACADNLGIYY